jgi:hypothetical protein
MLVNSGFTGEACEVLVYLHLLRLAHSSHVTDIGSAALRVV